MAHNRRQEYGGPPSRYEGLHTEAHPTDQHAAPPQTQEDDTSSHERAASRRRMQQSYTHMMATYARQQEQLANKERWVKPRTRGAEEPDACTLTHVNQTQDLLRAHAHMAVPAEKQSSSEWLTAHSIHGSGLTLKHLIDKGQIGKPGVDEESGKVQQHLKFESADINEFECKLNMSIESYTNRIKWLLQGSRRIFGLLKGSHVAIVVDASDANCGFGRLSIFQESLMHLIDEQLPERKTLYLTSFGSENNPLWDTPMTVNSRIIDEAKGWVESLQPSGGCNLLKALRQTLTVKGLDSVMIILGTTPDQDEEIISAYTDELITGRDDVTIQTVAYDCSNHMTNVVLRGLAKSTCGRYHCYASTNEEQIYTGDDISSLLAEIKTAQEVINKIKEMREGLFGTALVSVMNEISAEVAKLPQSRFLPRPPGHEAPLRLDMPKFSPLTSEEWLSKHGLKGRNLDLYQILAPNAYAYKEEFVPVIRKTVQSQVHQKAMAQFPWHDGSIKNVHVDMTQLYEYQKQLGAAVRLYEKRLDWLSSASRRIFGTIVEDHVVFLIDLSASNVNYLIHIQHSMRLLLEQQLANKQYFNIIVFGSEPKKFMPTMVKPTGENLQKAWRWLLDSFCEGSRNFLSAMRAAIENDEESKHDVEPEGVYVFTSGVPDQSQESIVSYGEEVTAGRSMRVHVTLFNVDDYDSEGAIAGRYANITATAQLLRLLAHCTGGRFHWFRETGIIESDDIAAITQEIDKGLNYSKKCAQLVDSLKKKYNLDADTKQLAITQGSYSSSAAPASRSIAWRPSSAKRPTSATSSAGGGGGGADGAGDNTGRLSRPQSAITKVKNKTNSRLQHQYFYTDGNRKGECGSVITRYPTNSNKANSKRLGAGGVALNKTIVIPDKEDQITTKQWLRKYSLSKLKLDLNKLVSGPECKHAAVKILNKTVESKVYNVFPTINVQGSTKYLQLRPAELVHYEDETRAVLHRYLKRLQWLLSGSRWVFGAVIGKHCVIVIDTSGSMESAMDQLKKELAALIWEQLHKHKIAFNLIRFSKDCEMWREGCVAPTQQNCHDAVQWVAGLHAHGNTCTLEALQMAFKDPDMDSVYLLTDGKPDTSTGLVLKQVGEMNDERNVVINTISFQCDDSVANTFLQTLARQTTGRYHRCHTHYDAHKVIHRLMTDDEAVREQREVFLPEFEGDDMRRLAQEIELARTFLVQAHGYKEMYAKHQSSSGGGGGGGGVDTTDTARSHGKHHCELSTDPPRPTTSRPTSARVTVSQPGAGRPISARPAAAAAAKSILRPTSAKV